jgi:hypothetical protein
MKDLESISELLFVPLLVLLLLECGEMISVCQAALAPFPAFSDIAIRTTGFLYFTAASLYRYSANLENKLRVASRREIEKTRRANSKIRLSAVLIIAFVHKARIK